MVKEWKRFDGDLLLTTTCPVECDFCVYGCGFSGEWMPEETIRKVAEEYTKNDVGIRISGGEPFYNLEKLKRCLDIVLQYQKPHEILVITSGFFGNDKEKTKEALKVLTNRKLDTLVVSSDRFHLRKVPLENLINIIKEAKKLNLKIILRITTDEKSYELMDDLAEIIVKYDIKVEPHHNYGVYGKAELLNPCLREKTEERQLYFNKKIVEYTQKYNKSINIKDYEEQSPKRYQRNFAEKFYPTTFPNGNIYGDSQCCKGSFMGNINEDNLKNIIHKFSKTLPGFILWSENSNCDKRMKKLIPKNVNDNCDYCRNQPLLQSIQKEAIGRQYLEIEINQDFETLFKKLEYINRELLLSFNLNEKDLNKQTGLKIISLLKKLKNNKKRVRISKPLPKCVLGLNYKIIHEEFNIPKNCYECNELFTVTDEDIISCEHIKKKGPKIYYMEDREQIWEFFNTLRLEKQLLIRCKNCFYLKRKQCDGLCFRK